jgi:GT2 family glycosyltransferase
MTVREDAPNVSVTVPSHNRREMLGRVLDGLVRQTYPPDRYEVVVVLDGSTDGSAEMVSSRETPYPLRLVENTKAGIAAVRNTCIRSAANPYVVFLDDDIVPEPSCLAVHAAAHRDAADEHVALGYCPPVVTDGAWWPIAMRAWWEDHFHRKAEPEHEWTYVDFVTGNVSFSRDLILGLGGFDEEFRSRHEDWELAIRLLEAGVRLAYYPDSKALHYADVTFAATVRHQRQEARDDVLLARKHPHVVAQLPLARYADGRPAPDERLVRRWLPWVDRFERHHMRGSWLKVTRRLIREAYLLGLWDAIPSPEDYLAFLAPSWRDDPAVVPLRLDSRSSFTVPPVGATELSVRLRGDDIARLDPVDAHSQWDWNDVVHRVLTGASHEVRLALVEEALRNRENGLAIVRERPEILVDGN